MARTNLRITIKAPPGPAAVPVEAEVAAGPVAAEAAPTAVVEPVVEVAPVVVPVEAEVAVEAAPVFAPEPPVTQMPEPEITPEQTPEPPPVIPVTGNSAGQTPRTETKYEAAEAFVSAYNYPTASKATSRTAIEYTDHVIDYINKVGMAFEDFELGREPEHTYQPELFIGQYNNNAKAKPKPRKKNDDPGILITSSGIPFQYQEAFHFLRTSIKFLSENKQCRKILITSSIPAEGKSCISANLALALTAANHTVGLIDADLRKPMLHTYLGIQDGLSLGLTNVLLGKNKLAECVKSYADRRNLCVVPCGVLPENPTEMLSSKRMGYFIDAMAQSFDYVIIDTAPVSLVTDASVLSQYVDGVLLVVRQKMATFDQVQRAKRNLEAVDAKIIGVVLNDFKMKHVDNQSGYYYSYYSHYPRYGAEK